MSDTIQITERLDMAAGSVDHEACVIRGVKVLGAKSKNGRKYRQDAVKNAKPMYEGIGVFLDHPKKDELNEPRKLSEKIGTLKGVVEQSGELRADLHLRRKHPEAEGILDDAEHNPGAIGLSHNVDAKVSRKAGETVVEEILRVRSVDLVAQPATTAGLFEQEDSALVDGIEEQQQEAQQMADEKQAAEVQSLREQVDSLSKELQCEREARVKREAEDAAFDLLESCGVTPDAIKIKALCALAEEADRKSLVESFQALEAKAKKADATVKPRSQEALTEQHREGYKRPESSKDFARRLCAR